MTTATSQRQPELAGQIGVIGGAGIGLETARRTSAEGAGIVLAGRNPDRLERAAAELCALSSAAFAAAGLATHGRFFSDLPEQIGHVMAAAVGPAAR